MATPSLTDDPALVASRLSATRRQQLLNRGYRMNKRSDPAKALAFLDTAEKQGLPVGRPVSSEEIRGAGDRDYEMAYKENGMTPPKTGLAGFDFRQAKDRGAPGVGGYDFNQQRMRQRQLQPVSGTGYQQGDGAQGPMTPQGFSSEKPLLPSAVGVQEQAMSDGMQWDSVTGMSPAKNIDPGFSQAAPSQMSSPQSSGGITMMGGNRYQGNQLVGADGSTNSGSIGGYDFSQTKLSPLRPVSEGGQGHAAYPSIHNVDRRAAFSRAWQNARSQNDRDAIVAKAHGLGVQMNADLARPSLERSGVVQPQNQAAPVRSSRYVDSPEYASARSRFNEMKTAFAQPRPADSIDYRAENDRIDTDIGRMKRESSEDTARYEQIPGWDNPDEYAAKKIAEVNKNQQRSDELTGKYQSDMREAVRLEDKNRRFNFIVPKGQTSEILKKSEDILGSYTGGRLYRNRTMR